MDLAACAKRVFIAMEHTTRDGKPRMLSRCSLPITAPGVVKLVATDLGLFEVTPEGFVLAGTRSGWNPEEIQELTEAKLIIPDDLREFGDPGIGVGRIGNIYGNTRSREPERGGICQRGCPGRHGRLLYHGR